MYQPDAPYFMAHPAFVAPKVSLGLLTEANDPITAWQFAKLAAANVQVWALTPPRVEQKLLQVVPAVDVMYQQTPP